MGRTRDPARHRTGARPVSTAATTASFAAHLLAQLGDAALAPAPIRQRLEDGAAVVIAPDSADAIAHAMGICSREQWPVRAAGAGTTATRAGGAKSDARRPAGAAKLPVVISTARLTAVTEHEPADLVIGVQAGLPLVHLTEGLASARQWLPLDPASHADSTVGAILACASAGPLRAGHGTPRDMALGLEVVTGDGRRLRFGGRVVKNVAGYDIVRLLIGSAGRLGILTHAFLRLRGLPDQDRTRVIHCGTGAAGARAAAELALDIRARIRCDALEVLSPTAAAPTWRVVARLTGTDDATDEAATFIRSLTSHRIDDQYGSVWWGALGASEAQAAAIHSTRVLPAELPSVLERAAASHELARTKPAWTIAAHAADGVIRAWQDGDILPETPPWPDVTSGRHPQPRIEQVTRQLYAAFDPAGILQPGAGDD
jgi:FAD/FMN-containing dehydrogenase